MTLYRDIISQALRLAWKSKFLWVFAFFAALAGNGGEYELAFSGTDSINGQSTLLGFLRVFYQDGTWTTVTDNLRGLFTSSPILAILFVLLMLSLLLLLVWLIIVAQAGLTWAIAQLSGKGKPTMRQTFTSGVRFFVPVFWVNAVAKVIVGVILLVVVVPLGIAYIRTGGETFNAYYILIAFFALVPVTIFLSFIVKYASTYIIVRGQRWREGLANGWRLFIHNWLVSVEVALVLFLINLVTTLVLVLLLFMLGLPKNTFGTVIFFTILTGYGVYMAAFQYSSWVLLFLQLDKGRVESGLNRWAASITARRSGTAAPAASKDAA